jgi:2-polyprenyl-3-methyl-5-hydroxy-6-metoxy-1,4-benzoquinol methylase
VHNPLEKYIDNESIVNLLRYVDDNFFSICKDKDVLEFGAAWGPMSSYINLRDPKKFTVVEPDLSCCKILDKLLIDENRTVHNLSYNDYYALHKEKYDVVLCCGLLYHLHSPIDLLEKIVNFNDPEYILITNIDFPQTSLSEVVEPINEILMRYLDSGITKPIDRNLFLSREDLITCLGVVGYEVVGGISTDQWKSMWDRTEENISNYLTLFRKTNV